MHQTKKTKLRARDLKIGDVISYHSNMLIPEDSKKYRPSSGYEATVISIDRVKVLRDRNRWVSIRLTTGLLKPIHYNSEMFRVDIENDDTQPTARLYYPKAERVKGLSID